MARPKGSKTRTKEQILAKIRKPSKPVGAPKLYNDEIIELLADDLREWMSKHEDNFFIYNWCEDKELDPTLPAQWAKANAKFNLAMRAIEKKQESRCFQGALFKQFDSRMATFALSCKHGWVDKSNLQLTGSNGSDLTILLGLANNDSKDLVDNDD